MQCASYLAINLSTIMRECCASYWAPGFTGEGAYLIDEVSIYNAIPSRNIIKLATALQDINFALNDFPNESKFVKIIWTLMMLNDTSSVIALLEELDKAYNLDG